MPETIAEKLARLRAAQSGQTIEEKLAALRGQQPPAPAQQPPGFLENLAIGARRTYTDYIEAPIYAIAEAGQEAARGNFTPAKQLAQQYGRSVVRGASLLGAGPGAPNIPQYVANEAAISETRRDQQKRRAQNFAFVDQLIERGKLNERAAADPSIKGKVTRFIGGAPVAAAPAIAAGVVSGGSIPAIAAVTALQSAGEPENAALNVGLSVVPVPAGKVVAPILRRLRADRAVTSAVESQAGGVLVGPAVEEAAIRAAANPALATAAERTPLLETAAALYKAGLLTGAKTHLKNLGGNAGFQLSEELSRVPGALADAVMSMRTGRRTLTGPSPTSVARSSYEAATKGMAEAWQAIRTGKTRFDSGELREIASGSKIVDTYVNGVFRTLKAEDAIFKSFAFRRALEDRARSLALTEIHAGKISRSQLGERAREIYKNPPEDISASALLDAEVATFNESNRLAEGIQAFKEKLPQGARFGTDLLLPFVKTPANIITRLLEYSPGGFVRGAAGVAQTLAGKVFTPAQQRSFALSFGRGSVGTGLIALGWKLHDAGLMSGLFEESKTQRNRDLAAGRSPGSIKVGDTWHQVVGFSPIGNLMAIGATLAREERQDRLQGADEQEGLANLGIDVLSQVIGETPAAVGVQNIASALREPGSTAAKLGGGILGGFVPTIASDVAEAIDPMAREATTLRDRVLKRVPFARQALPAATDVLGQPRQNAGPVGAMLDPTRSTTDMTRQNPVFAELVRLDAGISGFQPKPGETQQQYRGKVEAFGRLYAVYALQLIGSPQYSSATDTDRRELFSALNRIAKDIAEDGELRQARARLSPPALFNTLRIKRQRQAEQAKTKR